jgi:hypothetical protein
VASRLAGGVSFLTADAISSPLRSMVNTYRDGGQSRWTGIRPQWAAAGGAYDKGPGSNFLARLLSSVVGTLGN